MFLKRTKRRHWTRQNLPKQHKTKRPHKKSTKKRQTVRKRRTMTRKGGLDVANPLNTGSSADSGPTTYLTSTSIKTNSLHTSPALRKQDDQRRFERVVLLLVPDGARYVATEESGPDRSFSSSSKKKMGGSCDAEQCSCTSLRFRSRFTYGYDANKNPIRPQELEAGQKLCKYLDVLKQKEYIYPGQQQSYTEYDIAVLLYTSMKFEAEFDDCYDAFYKVLNRQLRPPEIDFGVDSDAFEAHTANSFTTRIPEDYLSYLQIIDNGMHENNQLEDCTELYRGIRMPHNIFDLITPNQYYFSPAVMSTSEHHTIAQNFSHYGIESDGAPTVITITHPSDGHGRRVAHSTVQDEGEYIFFRSIFQIVEKQKADGTQMITMRAHTRLPIGTDWSVTRRHIQC